jgi:hypothetical protein
MGFRLVEATNAWCIRRNRGDDRLRRLAVAFFPGFLEDWALLVEDCAAADGTEGIKFKHKAAPIKIIRIRATRIEAILIEVIRIEEIRIRTDGKR